MNMATPKRQVKMLLSPSCVRIYTSLSRFDGYFSFNISYIILYFILYIVYCLYCILYIVFRLETKIARAIGIMYKARSILSFNCLKSLYFCLIHSHLSYANIAWGSTCARRLKKLVSLQKHAVRVICNKTRRESITPSMKSFKILNVQQINIYQHSLFMHKFYLDKLPRNFDTFFKKLSNIGRYNLRSKLSNNFMLPPRKSKFSDSSISYRGPKIWNTFNSNQIKLIRNPKSFKYLTKKSLLTVN